MIKRLIRRYTPADAAATITEAEHRALREQAQIEEVRRRFNAAAEVIYTQDRRRTPRTQHP